jgi:hypothetical protein
MNYLDAIKLNHSVVSFSPANQIFYISLWNGVLRDGKVDDIDIEFFEDKHPTIRHSSLILKNKNILLSTIQFNHLSLLFPESD